MRQAFKCVECGLVLYGKVHPQSGVISAEDRIPCANVPVSECVCAACMESKPWCGDDERPPKRIVIECSTCHGGCDS